MPKPKRAVIRDDGVRYESTSAAARAVAGDQTNVSRACRTRDKAYEQIHRLDCCQNRLPASCWFIIKYHFPESKRFPIR